MLGLPETEHIFPQTAVSWETYGLKCVRLLGPNLRNLIYVLQENVGGEGLLKNPPRPEAEP